MSVKKGPFVFRAALVMGISFLLMLSARPAAAEDFEEMFENVESDDTSFSELLEVMDDQGAAGDYGRLYIPEVGISVALNYAENNIDDDAQRITDEWDSAVYMPWTRRQDMIADHWTQGFLNIRDCREGTRAYIKKEDRILTYVCTESTVGHNMMNYFLIETYNDHSFSMPVPYEEEALTESDETAPEEPASETLVNVGGDDTWDEEDRVFLTTPHEWTGYYTVGDPENESEPETQTEIFWGQPLEYMDDFDLFMYTCNGRWQDVYLALFRLEDILYL
ncbi:MAG: hypothetical protein J6S83_06530 [Lachnospiraceae bacterium]|nr:hypothetical protein [Lachnospiraceae bacterium]